MAEISIQERFWSKVDKSGDCWIWMRGVSDHGYGQFCFRGRMHNAHRVAWILTNGELPTGIGYHGTCVCHRCDNRLCVNPSHLFIGTHDDNMADKKSKNRQHHNYGTTNGRARLTVEQVRAIRDDKRTQMEIARAYGIGQSQVGRIKRDEQWRHA